MATGWLGGTFDPIHRGHLDVARAAQQALALDRVWIAPAGRPSHRVAPLVSAAHRFAMAALAIADSPDFSLSDIDMRPNADAYTWDLLDRLAASGVDLSGMVFVTGADAFRDIRSWHRSPALLDRCHFAVVSRPGTPAPSLRAALPELAGRMCDAPCTMPAQPSIFLIDMPTAPVASTDIRRHIADGQSLDGLVPPAVATYIARQRLYEPAISQDTA